MDTVGHRISGGDARRHDQRPGRHPHCPNAHINTLDQGETDEKTGYVPVKFVLCVVIVDSTATLLETTEEIREALFLNLYGWTCPWAGARAPLAKRTAMSEMFQNR